MSDQATKEKEWPTIEEQQSYWRTKEADLSLDKVEATTDYYDHFLAGNPVSEIPFQSNETDLSGGETQPCTHGAAVSKGGLNRAIVQPNNDLPPAQNFRLSTEQGKAPSDFTLAEQKWAEPEWTLRDEVGESYREIP